MGLRSVQHCAPADPDPGDIAQIAARVEATAAVGADVIVLVPAE